MFQEIKESDVKLCFDNICKNFGIVAGLNVSPPMRDRGDHGLNSIFIDINVGSHFDIYNQEILMNIARDGIRSKKDYRKLRALVRMRMINAVRGIQDLAEDSLRRLGAS